MGLHPIPDSTEKQIAETEIQNSKEMAAMMLLVTVSALVSVLSLPGVLGGMSCEQLPIQVCAFSVSSSGARCVLEKSVLTDGDVQYECQSSDIIATTAAPTSSSSTSILLQGKIYTCPACA